MKAFYSATVLAASIMLNSGPMNTDTVSAGSVLASDGQQALQDQVMLVAAETEQKTEPAPPGDVQERSIQRGTFGGPLAPSTNPPVLKPRASGFWCKQSENTCYCDRTETADCDLMKAYVCSPGSYVNTTVLDGECRPR